MEYYIFIKGRNIQISLENKEMNSGGQGWIYRIKSPASLMGYCVKIFKPHKNIRTTQERIEYMIANKPQYADMEKIRICWPEFIVFDKNKHFVGYLMPLAFENSRNLKILELNSFGKTIAQKFPNDNGWHGKFELDSQAGFLNRAKMLHNWALAIEILHKSGIIVIVDLKPENVLATPSGKISIVDTDSFQINDGIHRFKGPVATPEYFAKFAKDRHKNKLYQTSDCDCFAFAIAAYKILVGVHPYSGVKLLPPYDTDEYSDLSSRIDEGLFVFGKNSKYIQMLSGNNFHQRFFELPTVIKDLFSKSFTQNNQPSSTEWKVALKQIFSRDSKIKISKIKDTKFVCANSETRCLCVLVVDVSGSMSVYMNIINNAIQRLISDIVNSRNGFSEASKEQIELSIIQFDSNVDVISMPKLVGNISLKKKLRTRNLKTNTIEAIQKAIDVVKKRKLEYKSVGLPYYRPWILLLTDGNPDPYIKTSVDSMSKKLEDEVRLQYYSFTAIGIGSKVNKEFLRKISNNNFALINDSKISDFFQILSGSLSIDDVRQSPDNLLDGINKELADLI